MNTPLLNILLVEDDEVDVMTVKRAFEKAHISNPLFVAGNGLEALEKLRNGEVPAHRRLVLLDLNMPKMNGIEFLRELRKDPDLRATPVVVCSKWRVSRRARSRFATSRSIWRPSSRRPSSSSRRRPGRRRSPFAASSKRTFHSSRGTATG